jgi:hypothetical protein
MNNPKFWDEYEIKARYIPCFLTAIPFIHFLIQLLGITFWEAIVHNIRWMLVANISLSLIVTLAIIQLQCDIAKHWIEESIFGKGGMNFPTTNLLLFQDPILSKDFKIAIRAKIKTDFKFNLMDDHGELKNLDEAKKLARESVGFIRGYVGKGRMTHQYNIRYGFMRNLMGGSFWASAGCIGSCVLYGAQKNWVSVAFFAILALIILAILIFKKHILSKLAYQYAETLLNEYLIMKGASK